MASVFQMSISRITTIPTSIRENDVREMDIPSIVDDLGYTLRRGCEVIKLGIYIRENDLRETVVSGMVYSGNMHSGKRCRPKFEL